MPIIWDKRTSVQKTTKASFQSTVSRSDQTVLTVPEDWWCQISPANHSLWTSKHHMTSCKSALTRAKKWLNQTTLIYLLVKIKWQFKRRSRSTHSALVVAASAYLKDPQKYWRAYRRTFQSWESLPAQVTAILRPATKECLQPQSQVSAKFQASTGRWTHKVTMCRPASRNRPITFAKRPNLSKSHLLCSRSRKCAKRRKS